MEHKKIAAQGGTVHYWIDRGNDTAECLLVVIQANILLHHIPIW